MKFKSLLFLLIFGYCLLIIILYIFIHLNKSLRIYLKFYKYIKYIYKHNFKLSVLMFLMSFIMIINPFVGWYYLGFYYLFFKFIIKILDLFYPKQCFGVIEKKKLCIYTNPNIKILLKNNFYRINFILKLVPFLLKCFFFKTNVNNRNNKKYNYFIKSIDNFDLEIRFKSLVGKQDITVSFFKYYKSSIFIISLLLLLERVFFKNGLIFGYFVIGLIMRIYRKLNQ